MKLLNIFSRQIDPEKTVLVEAILVANRIAVGILLCCLLLLLSKLL
ncbi:MAG TPA: hypothetical protein VIM87_21690 [Chitinophaga sp.]